tara:strand:- start:152 stop:538 length:387 start_codon:yes stop_codon:yes gene_type:complete
MAKEIYNKNAREAHLMAEAYTQVNEGHAGPVPDWEEQAGLKDELEANRKEARRDREEDAEMEFDERGYAKNTAAGYEREEGQVFGLVDASGNIVSLYNNEGIMRQVMEGRPDLKAITFDELPFNVDVT